MSTPLLQIDDLFLEFATSRGSLRALSGIHLSVQPGEIFGVVGETGCGKTVTGLSVLGLLPSSGKITRGRILFDGVDLLTLSAREMQAIRGGRIAMIFQNPGSSLNPVFTIGSQMSRVIQTHLKLSQSAARKHAIEMLDAVGLPDADQVLKSYPHQLSGGMQQRAMIAAALACKPALLIADEPTTALDVTIQAQILALLKSLRERLGIAILLITHNLGVVAQTCDRVAVLYAGRVVETGTTRSLFSAPSHPYTQGLMAAIPRAASRGVPLTAIPGSVPSDPGAVTGCPFAPRCQFSFDRCLEEEPLLLAVEAGHSSACFLAEGAQP